MQRIFIILILCLPQISKGQAKTNKGIDFVTLSNWKEVKARAAKEHKFIFVDVYATWCGPCKKMDAEVYPTTVAGIAANEQFISVRVQQDKIVGDDNHIRAWYRDADSLCKQFQVSALPTLLFLSAGAELITKAEGYQNADGLVSLFGKAATMKASEWMGGEHQRKTQAFYQHLKSIAMEAESLALPKLADSLVRMYETNYLFSLDDSALYTRENILFITKFPGVIGSKDRFFKFFTSEPNVADQLVREGYSKDIITSIVNKEEIEPRLFRGGQPVTNQPDWVKLRDIIRQKYGDRLANSLTNIASQIAFYGKTKDCKQYAALINEAIKSYPPQINGHVFANNTMTGTVFQRDDWNLNTSAWDVFEHCTDKEILQIALEWSNLSIKVSGNENRMDAIDQYYDTKANLQYKLGDVKGAIKTEQKAYEIAKANNEKKGRKGGGEGYLATIKKMKEGIPAWRIVN